MMEKLSFDNRDEFKRKEFALKVLQLLDEIEDASPLAIDGAWGSGKTEFCLKTIDLMRKNESKYGKAVYFNAFQEDYADNPLLTLLSTVYEAIPTEKLKEVGARVFKTIAWFVGNMAVYKLTGEDGAEALQELKENYKNSNPIDKYRELFVEYSQRNNLQDEVRSVLEDTAREKKITIFIDELDRCIPRYAIKVLEAIKHLSDIKNVRIVFLISYKHLLSSIQKIYMDDEKNSSNYLDKFFSLKLTIPKFVDPHEEDEYVSNDYQKQNSSRIYLENLMRNDGVTSVAYCICSDPYVNEFLEKWMLHYDVSLRDVEQFWRRLKVAVILGEVENNDTFRNLTMVYLICSIVRNESWISETEFDPHMLDSLSKLNITYNIFLGWQKTLLDEKENQINYARRDFMHRLRTLQSFK